MDDRQVPFVSQELVSYLELTYSARECVRLATHKENADRGLGFIEGIQEVLTNLRGVIVAQNDTLSK